MKKTAFLFILILIIVSCSDDAVERNPYLPTVGLSFTVNLNLPLYSSLNTPGNSIYIGNTGVGIRGVFLTNTGSGFIAFEASCPNHTPNNCSTTTIKGVNCICACDNFEYNLFNGNYLGENDGQKKYSLLNYRTTYTDGSVTISN